MLAVVAPVGEEVAVADVFLDVDAAPGRPTCVPRRRGHQPHQSRRETTRDCCCGRLVGDQQRLMLHDLFVFNLFNSSPRRHK